MQLAALLVGSVATVAAANGSASAQIPITIFDFMGILPTD